MDKKKLAKFKLKILLNIWELHNEAKLLYKHKHYTRAYTLAHLALEESAKLSILLFLSTDIFHGQKISQKEIKQIFSSELFTNHKLKLRLVFLRLPGFNFQETITASNELNSYKNRSLYSDILNGEMYKPSDVVWKDKAQSVIDIVETTLNKGTLEDMGLTIKDLPNVTTDMLEDDYENVYLVSGAIFLKGKNAETYSEFLKNVVKSEETFNRLKTVVFHQSHKK